MVGDAEYTVVFRLARAVPHGANVAPSVMFVSKLVTESRREVGSAGVSVGRALAGVLANRLIP